MTCARTQKSAATISFSPFEDYKELDDRECFLSCKARQVIFNNDVIGSENVNALGKKDLDFHANFFNAKSRECALLKKSCDANEIIENLSKIRDQILRVAVSFQVIETSLECLKQNEKYPHNDFTRQLFPLAKIIQEDYLSCTMSFLEGCVLQRNIFG